ncbi:transcriptional regulatory protein [Pseudoclavibacter endophyticus]|uniref:Transcriptional regulatory protein n=1 Tax=Pseudoclavibacter endophyticus TaxID=1778590 RepID=A0A6H9WQI8_9MICO|nr:response regulator [Pseudoclavibacter endophyticus]KAB1649055.1 response regulator [Pseudoclavibacter endophyticus]GGA65854.1 transcriptional regulatory protein [Pseudoclavibacter endophyticus]
MTSSIDPPVTVVIVEDDDAVAALHRRYLETMPEFTVLGRAADVAGALALLERERPELVLLDLHLGDGSGMDLLRRVRALRPDDFDVIMITAVPDRAVVERAVRLGIADYLLKPFTQRDFAKRLGAYSKVREARRRAPAHRPLSQADIDALRDPLGDVRSLPKGLAPATHEAVSWALRGAGGPRTASEIGAEVGVSRVSARRYLEQLVRDGHATSRPRYGEPGRPNMEYVWVD